jgi:starch synthase (maltosyl-transferring)
MHRTSDDLMFARSVIIENVRPQIDGGRFPIKRVLGEEVEVAADIFTDGHDLLQAILMHRPAAQLNWQEVSMHFEVNDHWRGSFQVSQVGTHFYTLRAWVDRFGSWARDIKKKVEASQDVSIEVLIGVQLVEAAAESANVENASRLRTCAREVRQLLERSMSEALDVILDPAVAEQVRQHPDLRRASTYPRELAVTVDRERARYGSWYEMFPRSSFSQPIKHGTLQDCVKRLDYVADMGFDVLYLPPIHPVGYINRKGRNNAEKADAEDVGSPWAIGSKEGGHKSIHPQLGTLKDFKQLFDRARELRIELALDLALQCAPDHPYVKEHPEWFRMRPDGTVQYAENPPKKYQDIYPLDFETDDSPQLWNELRSVVLYWIEQGVRIFRVDNPHTKPFSFWEWLIREVKHQYPDVLFLSEAFTRPKVMYELAKLGFTQSYTYFTWRNTKPELMEYFTELTRSEVREYFRPNLWPNTPDILSEVLQYGGRPAFMARVVLAATLGANYGIYGPAFELCEHRALRPGSEEYLDSEKYQLRSWDVTRSDSLKSLIVQLNRIRRDQPVLQSDWSLRFHQVDNDQLIVYSKATDDRSNLILVVVNLDPNYKQSGWVDLPLQDFALDPRQPYQMHDLLTGARYLWSGPRNYVELDPQRLPAHIFQVRRHVRTEHDFDYYL